MKQNLEAALDFILHDEGGFVLKPNGAMGNCGLGMQTLIDYHALLRLPRPSTEDLKNLTPEDAKAVYASPLYWGRIHGDDLPAGVDYAAFDAAVNEGAGWGTLDKPGALRLLDITKDIADPMARVQAISAIRLNLKRKRPDWADQTINGQFVKGHGEGWTNRIAVWVPQRAAEMISLKSAGSIIGVDGEGQPRAASEDVPE